MKTTKQNMEVIESTISDVEIEQWFTLFAGGLNSLVQCGKKLVEFLERDENIYERLIAKSDRVITAGQLFTLEQFGRGKLKPELIIRDSPGAKRVVQLGLPYHIQEALLNKPIPLAVETGSGYTTELKRLDELTQREAMIAIDDGGACPTEKQIQKRQEQKADSVKRDQRWLIELDYVCILKAPLKLRRSDLEEFLKRLQPTADEIKNAMIANQV